MISIEDFKNLPDIDKHLYVRKNFTPCLKSVAFRKKLYGIGVNDADYMVKSAGLLSGERYACPAYQSWKDMIVRSCSSNYKQKKPTYRDVTVCDEWKFFSEYLKWWIDNQVDGWHLDKDIIGNGTIYSPDTCIFVPRWLNIMMSGSESSRGPSLIGCHMHKQHGKYLARYHHPRKGRIHIGYFLDEKEASDAWRSKRVDVALSLKDEMDAIDVRIFHGVVRMIMEAK